MLLIRKHIICDNPKCGQGNIVNPKGPKIEIFAGIHPLEHIYKMLESRGWKKGKTNTGGVSLYCPECNKPRKKGRDASNIKPDR